MIPSLSETPVSLAEASSTRTARTGVPGSSYAFEIAGRLGMSKEVLAEAESIAGGERKTLEGLIAEMEEHRRLSDEERQIAEHERVGLEAAHVQWGVESEGEESPTAELSSTGARRGAGAATSSARRRCRG